MAIHVQRHADISKQTMLLDGVYVRLPKWHICGRDLNRSVHEGHLKSRSGNVKI